ncbi:hypothetical protein, variant [Aphanomyces invadans]|uniref:BSD domain-containing protein n=1 Tax=Aphanomyces invadans TaxID=157072 RepID=A0A024TNH2_9STRA|nr:hypothetical protein, variant [Aphanomyces invadans]ETV95568.1 hypothetical protein, variant [Aphanomyces invadans]|eukprot:XP_008875761.1 hypothetical protein, variant [Aphanomyces invadans]
MASSLFSLMSAVKDSALATLSADLKEFSTTVQGDVAVAAKEVKKKVEATLAERSEQAARKDDEDVLQEADETTATTTSTTASVKATIFAFGSRLESVGTTFLHSADEFLGGWTADQHEHAPPLEELSSGRRFRLLALQEATDTYVDVPVDLETFQAWKGALSADDFELLQSEVLEHYPIVKDKFDVLVPGTVDAGAFWSHYLYKASLLAAQEQRGALLLEKVDGNDDDDEMAWDVESPTHDATAATADAGRFDSALDDAEEKKGEAATCAGANASTEVSERPQTPDEGWVDVPTKTEAGTAASLEAKIVAVAIDDEDVVDWGDDDDDDAPAAAPEGKMAPATDEWGQWE